MTEKFCRWLLYRQMGWKKNVTETHPDKYIICLAPHTSNWDFILGQLYMRAEGMKSNTCMAQQEVEPYRQYRGNGKERKHVQSLHHSGGNTLEEP